MKRRNFIKLIPAAAAIPVAIASSNIAIARPLKKVVAGVPSGCDWSPRGTLNFNTAKVTTFKHRINPDMIHMITSRNIRDMYAKEFNNLFK